MPEQRIPGIHHVTAIAGDAQRNVDFYVEVLGLRLVKRTVNFDDPTSYHLYYGDDVGRPGTILTFFSWPRAPRGFRGAGQVTVTAFAVPEGAIGYWRERLQKHQVRTEEENRRFAEKVLTFFDPDGLQLELVGRAGIEERAFWSGGPVPGQAAVRGFDGVTIAVEKPEPTAELLTATLGFRRVGTEGSRNRFEAAEGGPGCRVDLLTLPGSPGARMGVGTVHHVAWRAVDVSTQQAWRQKIADLGLGVTPVIDRQYFQSIYFREPGGVLFEIATDGPGFTVDEEAEKLGTALKLPPWLEPKRAQIESVLPPIQPPSHHHLTPPAASE